MRDDAPVTVASVPVEKAEIAAPAATRACRDPGTGESAAAGLGRADQSDQGKDHHGESRRGATASLGPLVMSAPQATIAPAHFAKNAAVEAPLPAPPGARPGILGTLPIEAGCAAATPATYQTASAASVPVAPEPVTTRAVRGPWLIQVGAFPKETEALERLREAQAWASRSSPRPSRSPRSSSKARRNISAPASTASARRALKPPASTSSAPRWPASPSATPIATSAGAGTRAKAGFLLLAPKIPARVPVSKAAMRFG